MIEGKTLGPIHQNDLDANPMIRQFLMKFSSPMRYLFGLVAGLMLGAFYPENVTQYWALLMVTALLAQQKMFVDDITHILTQCPVESHQFDDELLTEVLSIAESFFVYGSKEERDAAKTTAVHQLMAPYFSNNDILLEKTVGHVWRHVKKTSMLRRARAKIGVFFWQTARSEIVKYLRDFLISLLTEWVSKIVIKRLIILAPLLLL